MPNPQTGAPISSRGLKAGIRPLTRVSDMCGAWVAVDPNDPAKHTVLLDKSVAVHCDRDRYHEGLHSYSTEFMTVTWHV